MSEPNCMDRYLDWLKSTTHVQPPGHVCDYNGKLLSEGAHVEGWYDGVPYTATVKEIKPQEAGSGYRRIILICDNDHTEVWSFSDAVAVIEEEGV